MVWMIEVNKIYSGHALEVLKIFDDESINMCITSPPYWGLRDYKTNPVKWSDGWGANSVQNPILINTLTIYAIFLMKLNVY